MSYAVYLDDHLIYSPYVSGLELISAVIEYTQNDISTFEFEMPASNRYINDVERMRLTVRVYDDGELLFSGLVCEDTITFENTRLVRCKDDWYYLKQTIQRPWEWNGSLRGLFEFLIERHNQESSHTFHIGRITVTDPNDVIVRSDSTYLSTWESIKAKFLDYFGGYLLLRYESNGIYIDYLDDIETLNTQTVTFSKNLLDVTRQGDGLEIATVLIPLGAEYESTVIVEDEDHNEAEVTTTHRTDITSVNGGKDYIEHEAGIALYGRIMAVHEWEDVTVPSTLLSKAIEYLDNLIYQTLVITISFVDLSFAREDSRILMGSYIHVISSVNGIDDYYLPTAMTLDLFAPENNTVELTSSHLTGGGNSVTTIKRDFTSQLIQSEMQSSQEAKRIDTEYKEKVNTLKYDLELRAERLYAKSIDVDELNADVVNISQSLSAANAKITNLEAEDVTINNALSAQSASINTLSTNKADVTALNAQKARIDSIEADYVNTTRMNAAEGRIGTLETDTASINTALVNKADIDFANVRVANVSEAWIKDLLIQGQIIAQSGVLYYLDAVHINANSIDAGTLKADRILLSTDEGLYYQLNLNTLGQAVISEMTSSEIEELKHTIHADNIMSHSITADHITVNNLVGTGGWINLALGTFRYFNVTSGNGISWDGSTLSIQADSIKLSSGKSVETYIGDELIGTVTKVEYAKNSSYTVPPSSGWTSTTPVWENGKYIWMRTTIRTDNGESVETVCITGARGEKGEDSVVLRIDSSRGNLFKNNLVSTILTVTIQYGSVTIRNLTDLHTYFGVSSCLEWKWKRMDDTDFHTIISSDSRISDDGFSFTLSPSDVDVKTVFSCDLII